MRRCIVSIVRCLSDRFFGSGRDDAACVLEERVDRITKKWGAVASVEA